MQKAIKEYNRSYSSRWSFRGLHSFFDNIDEKERVHLMDVVIPHMTELGNEGHASRNSIIEINFLPY